YSRFQYGQLERGCSPWAPFASREEWELARWIHKNGLSQRATDEFLTSGIVRRFRYSNFRDNKSYLEFIDNHLPGPQATWKLTEISVKGTVRDTRGQLLAETLDLWGRDPVEIIQDLISHAPFDGHLAYAP
ncbi:hypothetical protein K474DRAFT_1580196, partial [Panus rudis PR-1116 ss-1]